MERISKPKKKTKNLILFSMDSIWISRGQVRLEDAVVSQATNKRLLADNENTDSTNKSSVDLIKKKK